LSRVRGSTKKKEGCATNRNQKESIIFKTALGPGCGRPMDKAVEKKKRDAVERRKRGGS